MSVKADKALCRLLESKAFMLGALQKRISNIEEEVDSLRETNERLGIIQSMLEQMVDEAHQHEVEAAEHVKEMARLRAIEAKRLAPPPPPPMALPSASAALRTAAAAVAPDAEPGADDADEGLLRAGRFGAVQSAAAEESTKGGEDTEDDCDSLLRAGEEFASVDVSELQIVGDAGRGAMAHVHKALWRGKRVAVKELHVKRHARFAELMKIAFTRELEVLAKTRHPQLVACFGVSLNPFCVINEFCAGGHVFDLVHNTQSFQLTWEQRYRMLRDVALGMDYLHQFSPQIIHRDLKSPNLLLKRRVTSTKETPEVKVADFGMARMLDKSVWANLTPTVGTYHWMAPEMQSGKYCEKVDIYSYAIITYELCYCTLPFHDQAGPSVLRQAVKGVRPDLSAARCVAPGGATSIACLLEQCWAAEPAARPSFAAILSKLAEMGEPGPEA
eukprot:TRINITY_DN21436_c0_g2_i4.p1 TRINITY_DN21436_c0_g2~~TRINITY_DN21436_c0_g2_i4.p1  ORF type:complete len:465 (+),score=132.20 TRINITY_DN21436_c0_g2_i4:63-1397(+)